MKGTPGIIVILTCMGCASAAVAQTPDDYVRLRESRQTQVRKADVQAQAKARVTGQKRARTARGVQRSGSAEASETISRTVRLENGATFDLRNFAGDVTVTGGTGREATIEAIKTVRGVVPDRVRTLLNAVRIDIAERGGNVEVRTIHPPGASQVTVAYAVRLPANTNVILRSTSGNLHVENIAGDELTANTLSGNVIARDLRSRLVELHTVDGNMQLQEIAARRAWLQSFAGNLEYAGRFLPAGRYQFQTHRGHITVTPSGTPGFDLEATTYRGNLRSDFPLKAPQAPSGVRRGPLQKILRGTVGDAGAMLTMTSFGGDILIVKP